MMCKQTAWGWLGYKGCKKNIVSLMRLDGKLWNTSTIK